MCFIIIHKIRTKIPTAIISSTQTFQSSYSYVALLLPPTRSHLGEESETAGVGGERGVLEVLPQRPSEVLRELRHHAKQAQRSTTGHTGR